MKNLKTEDLPPDRRYLIVLIALGLFVVGLGNTTQLPDSPPVIFSPVPLEEWETAQVNQNSFVALGCPFIRERSLGSRVVTGYSSTVDQCDSTPFITADGSRVAEGGIACPRYIPFDTMIMIDGEIYICNDRMNKRYAHRFDIWFADRISAIEFGVQKKEIIQLN